MFDLWMILVVVGISALLAGFVLVFFKKTLRVGLIVLTVGVVLSCAGVLRARHRQNVTMSVARTHKKLHNGMSKSEVKALLGPPDYIAFADTTGNLQAPWKNRRDLDIPEAALAWEYRPHDGLHCYRVYFDVEGSVIGKAAD